MRGDRARITIRDLMIALAIVSLMLAGLAHRRRAGPSPRGVRLSLRVFNETGGPIRRLRYEWTTVGGLIERSGVNSGNVNIAPGGSKSFRMDIPGPVDFTLSCSTPNGMMSSGLVRIGTPGPMDFHVGPSEVRAVPFGSGP